MDMPYQMIHRTASACYPQAKDRAVVYQYFGIDERMDDYYKKELSKMRKLVGRTDKLKFYLYVCSLVKSDRYKALEQRWDKKERELGKEVKEGILNDDLLDFGPQLLTILY